MSKPLMAQLSEKDPFDDLILTADRKSAKPCLANALLALRHDATWKGVLAYNEFSRYVITELPAPWQEKAGANWTDDDDSRAADWLQHEGILVPTHIAGEAVQVVARDNPFHPVRDYLRRLKWDGQPRIDTWLTTYLGAKDSQFVQAVGPRWLIAGVARIFIPGCQSDYTLLLEGPQGILKSTALRVLAGDDWFTDHLSDLGSKDSRMELCGKWIIEMGELDRIRGGKLEVVKNFLTARQDHFRLPYGRRAESVPRSAIFAATTNDSTPFTDETGNRRFWPVRCGQVDIAALKRDRDQLWAEAYTRFAAGEVWWLDTKALNDAAGAEQDERYEGDVWDDTILEYCDEPHRRAEASEPCDSGIGRVTLKDVLVHGLGISIGEISHSHNLRVRRCLVHAGWKRWQDRKGKNRGKWFYVRGDDE